MRREDPPVRPHFNCLRVAWEFFADCYAKLDPSLETLWVVHLDREKRCVHVSRHEGDAVSAPFPLKAIVRDAIQQNSAGLLLAHNHPSGDARPSDADLRVTRRLCVVSEALDCEVVDHLILAGDDCTSFRSLGLL